MMCEPSHAVTRARIPSDTEAFNRGIEKNKAAVNEINKEIPKAKENIIISIRKMLDPTTA